MSDSFELFTDGACRGNPGPGGWGALVRHAGVEKSLWGGDPATTNNRMELMAAIRGLEAIPEGASVALTTDSQYVRQGITDWIVRWKRNGWRTASKQPVKNEDLWRQLDVLADAREVAWHWVKGHSGHRENELVDALANRGTDEASSGEAAGS